MRCRFDGVRPPLTDSSGRLIVAQGPAGAAAWPVSGTLVTQSDDEVSAFGERLIAAPRPITGWTFAYNQIHTELQSSSTTGAGALAFSEGKAVLTTGAAITSTCLVQTRRALHYLPGLGGLVRFTAIFPANGGLGSSREVGIGDAADGFFVGYRDSGPSNLFGVIRRRASVETFVAQSAFNMDPLDGTGSSGITLAPAQGNVFQIRYQWLGFGAITFYIENPTTGRFVAFHRIRYSGTSTGTSVLNPQLPVRAAVENTTKATATTLETASAMAFIEGEPADALKVPWVASATRTGVTAEATILNLRALTTINTVASRIVDDVVAAWVSTNGGSQSGTLRIYRAASVGGAPVWSAVPRSVSVEIDTTGTLVAAGAVTLAEMRLARDTAVERDLLEKLVDILPSEILTVTGQTGGAAQSWEVSVSGVEPV